MNCCRKNKDGYPSGEGVGCTRYSMPVRFCVAVLKGYKRFLSPMLPPSCRFTPTCSEYAIEAVRSRGLVRGLILALFRLLRCHPFAKGGYDPVK